MSLRRSVGDRTTLTDLKHVDTVNKVDEINDGKREQKKIEAARNPLVPEIFTLRQSVAQNSYCEYTFLVQMRM